MFSKKATIIDEIFNIDLTLCSKRQINGEDFINFHVFLKKYELYKPYIYKKIMSLQTDNYRQKIIMARIRQLKVPNFQVISYES